MGFTPLKYAHTFFFQLLLLELRAKNECLKSITSNLKKSYML